MEDFTNKPGVLVIRAKPEGQRKTFKPNIRALNKIPDVLMNDPLLNRACESLPQNYNFEIHKTIWRIRSLNAKRVALQLPEGNIQLLFISCISRDIILCLIAL